MCGVIGFLSKEKDKSAVEIFEENAGTILARGIHFDKLVYQGECYGYSRLPTDDVDNNQLNTISGFDKQPLLLFNGLITNVDYLVKRFNLPQKAKRSDTLCLLYGFKKYKKEFLSHCRGMFAFAYITEYQVILARDTIGVKPLYYAESKDFFAFSSEIKSLISVGKIQELLPGEIVSYDKKNKRLRRGAFSYKSYRKFRKEELRDCLLESVVLPTKRYLAQTNKNIGILLSGGLDSSIVAKLLVDNISKKYRKRLIAFGIGVNTSRDILVAKRLSKHLKLHFVRVKPFSTEKTLSSLREVVYKVESSQSRVVRVALLQEALVRKIKKYNIDVILSGEGADELFFGYQRFIDGLIPEQIERLYFLFYKQVFYSTLLQRYERIFARSQIEGRVPFLDQELVALAKKITTNEKILYTKTGYISKVPLRLLAKSIDLPPYIYLREKEKMTLGATGKDNCEREDGYLV